MAASAFTAKNDRHAYVKVTPMVAGYITCDEATHVHPFEAGKRRTIPCMCFIVEHGNKRIMFDLGLRSNPQNYVPMLQAHIAKNRQPSTFRPSADEILRANGIAPESINAVILSHVHWDHHGDPTSFPNARFFVGKGTVDILENGIGHGAHSQFDPELFAHNDHHEFSEPALGQSILKGAGPSLRALTGQRGTLDAPANWQELGPFPFAADIFGDGSTYIVPAPGHLPGHMNLLCRVGADQWVYLGGDSYHDARILTGEKSIGTWLESGKTCCVHIDQKQALESIERIKDLIKLMQQEGLSLEVIAAHDVVWFGENKHRCLEMPASTTMYQQLVAFLSQRSSSVRQLVRRLAGFVGMSN